MADDRMRASQQQASLVYSDLIESLIVDIATDGHRATRLGFDYKLNVEEEEEVRLAAHARAVVGDSGTVGTEIGNKHTIDVFGQTHPTIANEMFQCMNCSRPIVAGRFAPHLEKCMGKGRKARMKASRNLSSNQQHRSRSSHISSRSRSSHISSYGSTGSGTPAAGRTPPNKTSNQTLEDIQRDLPADANHEGGESEKGHDNDEKHLSCRVTSPGNARSEKSPGEGWKCRANLKRTSASSELDPVPLQVSPVRALSAASGTVLAEAAPVGSLAEMTVDVAGEQFSSFVSGSIPTSCGMASQNGSKQQAFGQSHVKIRSRVKKKKKNFGHVPEGSTPITKFSEPGKYEDRFKQTNRITA